ncbi:MAG: hypothetical protein JXR82_14385 [Marinifilaceae bacterium]|nr:hypothetical protein [Marinifilaceae bacterium]
MATKSDFTFWTLRPFDLSTFQDPSRLSKTFDSTPLTLSGSPLKMGELLQQIISHNS